ncbi:MAG TPA: YwiC-like family protein, partial [Candidatus Polarisedimenticolaceae bacterium]|nr:YwiC-like family protein [Candidatus Polarisedimenticolaceae bacterium]
MRSSWAPPKLPAQHGAWVMLVLPWLLGLARAGARPAALCVVPAFFFGFLARDAWRSGVERWRLGRSRPAGYLGRRWLWGALYLGASALALAAAIGLASAPAR